MVVYQNQKILSRSITVMVKCCILAKQAIRYYSVGRPEKQGLKPVF